jgi:VWFA-related protein
MQARYSGLAAALAAALLAASASHAQEPQEQAQSFRFRSAVELVNVNATVTDASGHFVSGLRKEDFRVYEDERPQTITHFSSERVPVSLGIVLDASGSMEGEKMAAARRALNRFLFDLLGPDDEIFLYRFDADPDLVQGWTTDRRRVSDALARIRPAGGTALYDAVAAAVPLARSGRHRKKALVIISDGNDTSSTIDVVSLQALIRESELLVYAIGIDSQADTTPWWIRDESFGLRPTAFGQRPVPRPFPIPGGARPRPGSPRPPSPLPPPGGTTRPPRYPAPPPSPPRRTPPRAGAAERVNVAALRDITDDSGGRTEIIRSAYDLDPATAGIADELSKQYYLGYPAGSAHDGRWHTIRVEVRQGQYRVRARTGYMATEK